jgi:hypothetical protein
MWDNRTTKRNPKAPNFKCRDKNCDGCIWPPRGPKKDEKPAYVQQDRGSLPNDDVQDAQPQSGNESTKLYFAAMKYVVNAVVPVWEAGQIPYTAADINAATATIMIDHQRRSGR